MFRRPRTLRPPSLHHFFQVPRHHRPRLQLTSASASSRALTTLAIETSCDDTAVAVLSRSAGGSSSSGNGHGDHGTGNGGRPAYRLLFNERIASDNRAFRGINPVVAVQGHNAALAKLVRSAIDSAGRSESVGGSGPIAAWRPDFVCATRGPGIMSNLAVGLNMAKGLAVAWGVPLLGVHHMQAHALTPRLVHALGLRRGQDGVKSGTQHGEDDDNDADHEHAPAFPFLSLLVSGGHTQLVLSEGVAAHRILAATADVAIGNFLDHAAREILPRDVLDASPDVMYGRLLEAFAFGPGDGEREGQYAFFTPARSRGDEAVRQDTGYAWDIPLPLRGSRKLAFSFASFRTAVEGIAGGSSAGTGARAGAEAGESGLGHAERVALARHAMRAAFQHLAGRVVLALEDVPGLAARARTLVVAGGVASNRFLMHVLRRTLAARGFGAVRVVAPPAALCTDNAAMVAWAGMELWDQGWCSDLGVLPIGRWPMEVDGGDGDGIMGAGGWLRRDQGVEHKA
ncbi:tRNA N6-adenosine threonylcarbamoyltransferase [Escovopsis weberi]|uniref:tRNA N6-adenosine threonylcarbamoyltransferase n=1 Tax=Escovopsis weberi TaxID=150374 RepID=A0A0M9VU08_ESCWE|nr:tRNA N6-adenosine threonylcarbamoyltransferase [Escovopsis weberi]